VVITANVTVLQKNACAAPLSPLVATPPRMPATTGVQTELVVPSKVLNPWRWVSVIRKP